MKPTHEIEGNASTKRVKAMRDDMRNGDFDWEQSPISVVTHEDGTRYVVDGHHRLAAARMANVDAVGIRDVTGQLNNGGFLSYKNMDDVVESASTFLGNRLNRRKL
ncbi:ParB/Srx family N-terminal domain-containing protein [Streptomyces sp. NPDC048211]|uniref:ParB/Srx family N-terminal domain-containing protein n=1 Tax=Streptomyces sp. NPDC048211 TaxID=3365516 RepID=UPI00371687B5